jgi:hypothetical protein
MATMEEFQYTKDYKLWNNLREICDTLEINESKISSLKDFSEYWEPFFERIYKLGVFFKQCGKLKEIKIHFIRPIFFCETSDKIIIEGKTYDTPKEFIDQGGAVFRNLRALVVAIHEIDKLTPQVDAPTLKKTKKLFQDSSSAFFKSLNIFAKKGAQEMHNTCKQILKPLRELVKANFRLFLCEKKEEGDLEITLFQDKKDMKAFTENIIQHFTDEENKMKKQNDIETEIFDDFINKPVTKDNYKYTFTPKQRDNYQMTDNTSIRKTILHKKFEESIQGLLKYLYEKKKDDFFVEINVGKLFRNLEILPKSRELKPCKFFMGQMLAMIKDIKERLYEMKINGSTRMKIPVSDNAEFLTKFKQFYDLHLSIDNLFGDKLRYDQFLFFYNCITFIVESSVKEEITIFKDKAFMEEAVPKYVILSALKNSVVVMNKMKEKNRTNNELFSYDNFYQIKKFTLGSENNIVFNSFEPSEVHKKLLTKEIEDDMKTLNEEIKEFEGRFWILEEFFDPNDRELWLEGIELLKDINFSVIDDLRDFIFTNYSNEKREKEMSSPKKDTQKGLRKQSSSNIKLSSRKSVTKDSVKLASRPKRSASKKKTEKVNNLDKTDLDDDSVLFGGNNKVTTMNLDNLRPPNVWNFPIEAVKKSKDAEKKEIRNVDPRNYYKDGRVGIFLEILNKITTKMMEYCRASKPNLWLYFFENILKIHSITYNFPEKTVVKEEVKKD